MRKKPNTTLETTTSIGKSCEKGAKNRLVGGKIASKRREDWRTEHGDPSSEERKVESHPPGVKKNRKKKLAPSRWHKERELHSVSKHKEKNRRLANQEERRVKGTHLATIGDNPGDSRNNAK